MEKFHAPNNPSLRSQKGEMRTEVPIYNLPINKSPPPLFIEKNEPRTK